MSVSIMGLVWEKSPYKGSDLITLLALADWSDDSGVSWPSVRTLAVKTRQSERNTQYCLRQIQKDGYLVIIKRKESSSQYKINVSKLSSGAKIAPILDEGVQNEAGGVQSSVENLPQVAPNTLVIRQENHTLKPTPYQEGFSLNNEDPKASTKKLTRTEKENIARNFAIPGYIPRIPWDAWVEMRIEKGNCPTAGALHIAVAKLEQLEREGCLCSEVLNESTMRGWQGLFATKNNNGNGNKNGNDNGYQNGSQSRTNGAGTTGHLLDHLPGVEEIKRRRAEDDLRLEQKRAAKA